MSYLYTGPPLTTKNGKPAAATLGAMVGGRLSIPGRFPLTPVRLPMYQAPAAAPSTSTAIVKIGPDMHRPPIRYMGPPIIDQVQTGMTATPAPPAPSSSPTLCPIDATGARVCTQVQQTGTTAPKYSPLPTPSQCVNVDPTSGQCLDSSILASQSAGLTTPTTTTTPATCVNVDPNTGACLDQMIGGFDLATIPGWVWYVLFGGTVYWLFFKKRGR